MKKKGKPVLIVLSAPSGAGKTTLKDGLIGSFPDLGYSISATTRPMRAGEKNGIHYHFKTREEFQKMIENDELVEYNQVHGNFYGTPRSSIDAVLNSGKSIIFDLDVYGKTGFDKVYPEAVGILILPPSLDVLKQRLIDRKSDSAEAVELRLKNAEKEIRYAKSSGKYEYTVINDALEDTQKQLRRIVGLILGNEDRAEDG